MERLAVAPETISRFERGATLPSLVTLQRFGQVLKSPMAELMTESSPAPDDQAAVVATWIAGQLSARFQDAGVPPAQ